MAVAEHVIVRTIAMMIFLRVISAKIAKIRLEVQRLGGFVYESVCDNGGLQAPRRERSAWKLEDLEVADAAVVKLEAEGGPEEMEALETTGAGIHDHHIVFRVMHDAEYV